MSERIIIEDGSILDGIFRDIRLSKDFLEEELKKLEIKSKEQDISMRKEYANKTFSLVCLYMIFVFLLIILACSTAVFNMSDNVLMVLLGTTTINVIGLFAIVMKNLFPNK
jgi:hypothetical protein